MLLRAAKSQPLGKFVKVASEHPSERPEPGDLVRIHYVGTLEDGSVFDSSRARGQPFEFNLGESQVIDGWDMLIGTMALGERASLVVPPEYAYGEAGAPPLVPPGATLTFDVELLDIGRPVVPEDPEAAEPPEALEALAEGTATRPFWEQEPEREGGRGCGFAWRASGAGAEICVSVPLRGDVRVREIRVDVRTHSLVCRIGERLILEGDLFGAVDSDDSHWDLERNGDGISLLIYLVKLDPRLRWESLLRGGAEASSAHEAEVVDVDAALHAANEQSRRKAKARLL